MKVTAEFVDRELAKYSEEGNFKAKGPRLAAFINVTDAVNDSVVFEDFVNNLVSKMPCAHIAAAALFAAGILVGLQLKEEEENGVHRPN